jgi:hypothetical protein
VVVSSASACACSQVRQQFRDHVRETDEAYIRTLLAQGSRQLDIVRAMVRKVHDPVGAVGSASDDDEGEDDGKRLFQRDVHVSKPAEDFVVGVGWPWERGR